jgi:Tol biopolymer transport system component/DNA-binding winged helix-turn-helix (wHTH) protein
MSLRNDNLFEFSGFTLDLSERILRYNGEHISLAPKVAETLCVLVENHGRLMTKDELFERLWPDTFVEERNLSQNIFTLRKILRTFVPDQPFIETVPRRGYWFVADVTAIQTSYAADEFSRTDVFDEAPARLTGRDMPDLLRPADGRRNGLITPELIASDPRPRLGGSSQLFRFAVGGAGLMLAIAVAAGAVYLWTGASNFSSAHEKGRPQLEFQRLTDSGHVMFPAVSPDDRHMAFIVHENSTFAIMLQNLATGSRTEVVPAVTYELRSPQFSIDGNHLFYAARDGKAESTVYKIPVFGGTPQQIVTGVMQNFSISPEGERLAFFRAAPKLNGNQLVITDSEGEDEKVIATIRDGAYFRVWNGIAPSWTADGKRLAAAVQNEPDPATPDRPNSYLVEVTIDSGDVRPIKMPDWFNVYQSYWDSDGNGLIVQVQERSDSFFQLWHLDYPGGTAVPLTNDSNNYTNFAVDGNGKFILATEDKTPYDLQIISLASPDRFETIASSTALQRGVLGIDWTPDGKTIVYQEQQGSGAGNIWKIGLDLKKATQLTSDRGARNQYPAVSPDGGTVFFASNRDGNWHIWSIDIEGGVPTRITNGIGETRPRISPEGEWLIYASPGQAPNSLWKMRLADGTLVKLLDNAAKDLDVSPDGTQILTSYYDPVETKGDPWKHVIVPAEKGGHPKVAAFSHLARAVQWNPSGDGIYYLSPFRNSSNIWHYSLSTQKSVPLTNYGSQEIASFRISPDGTWCVMSTGSTNSNIYKITGIE